MNKSELIEGYPEAICELKRSLHILSSMDAQLAAAAISMKLVDVLDGIVNRKFEQALAGIWACTFVVHRILYESFSEKLGKTSHRAVVAKRTLEKNHSNFKKASKEYMGASLAITKGTGFEMLFTKDEHGPC